MYNNIRGLLFTPTTLLLFLPHTLYVYHSWWLVDRCQRHFEDGPCCFSALGLYTNEIMGQFAQEACFGLLPLLGSIHVFVLCLRRVTSLTLLITGLLPSPTFYLSSRNHNQVACFEIFMGLWVSFVTDQWSRLVKVWLLLLTLPKPLIMCGTLVFYLNFLRLDSVPILFQNMCAEQPGWNSTTQTISFFG